MKGVPFITVCITALVMVAANVSGSAAVSANDGTVQMRVVNVAPNDVLNIREYPSGKSRIIGIIPPTGRGIEYIGEPVGIWVLVRFDNTEGWVGNRFLTPEVAGAGSDETSYSYVAVDPYPADGDPFLALRSYPSASKGERIVKMRNGTLLHVLQRRADGWWFVETPSGVKGWAKSGAGAQAWIQCCVSEYE